MLRTNFQDEERFDDHLSLTQRLNQQLRELSARGRKAPLIFVDAAEFPEAYSLAGRYRLAGETVEVTLRLFRDKQRVGEFTISGSSTVLEQLVTDILQATEKQIAKQ